MSTEQTADELLRSLFSIRRTGRRIAGRPTELASLTGAQLELARLVRRRPGISVADAASELQLAPNTVSTLVGELTDAGILVRTVDDADRRVARLDALRRLRRKVDAWRDRRVAALGRRRSRELPAAEQRGTSSALAALAQLANELEGDRRRDDASGRRVPRPAHRFGDHAAVDGDRPGRRAGRGVRAARAERRRQDDHDPRPQHAAAAAGGIGRDVRPRRPRLADGGAPAARLRAAAALDRGRADRPRERQLVRAPLRRPAPRAQAARRRRARGDGPRRRRRPARGHLFGRDGAAARAGAGARQPAGAADPRRADRRARPGRARRRLAARRGAPERDRHDGAARPRTTWRRPTRSATASR